MKNRGVSLLIAGLAVGLALGWFARDYQADSETRSLVVMYQLERVSFAANTLAQLPPDASKSKDLQLLALRSALTELDELSGEREIRLPAAAPSLRDGLRRAQSYAETHDLPDLAEKAGVISERLFAGA